MTKLLERLHHQYTWLPFRWRLVWVGGVLYPRTHVHTVGIGRYGACYLSCGFLRRGWHFWPYFHRKRRQELSHDA